MIENAIIFSKESREVLVTSIFGKVDPNNDDFNQSLTQIREIGSKLEKGVFNLDLENNLTSLILGFKNISVALIFDSSIEKKELHSWENVAKEIGNRFEKIFETNDRSKFLEYKETLNEIVEWHLKEHSPIDKMKDALW
ncbi:MAG: hypothetical protein EAX90_12445 [Candidatus Heimdallarchaeota archaeon]|nr:hypothetical protein [Candidatus Heimdallarchaeota archaeon]HUU76931.1 hypothetical protein [candidate division Zixibacteria bacterium]